MPTDNTKPQNRESELRVFNINVEKMRDSLKSLGAEEKGRLQFKRAVLDVIPVNSDKWIRVRTDGQLTTLAIKERISDAVNGTGEVEIEVPDFDKTLALLDALGGYKPRSIQESIRELYIIDSTEVSIDTWPKINPILEIEGDEDKIFDIAAKLGVATHDLTAKPVEKYYLETLGLDVKTSHLRFQD